MNVWLFVPGHYCSGREDENIVAGSGMVVTFSGSGESGLAGILQADEGAYIEGKWQLN
jgi:hypothetical protein